MYGIVDGPMTESTPYNFTSHKGEIRAGIANLLMAEIEKGILEATIARSADFYGPYGEKNSVPYLFVIGNLAHGKKAQWLANPEKLHSLTYTGDCGKALYLLATTDDAQNQIWHLPTASPPITGVEFIRIAAEKLGKKAKYQVISGWMLKLAGIFNEAARESIEMIYQYRNDYVFYSSKFEKRFGFTPTSYEKGIEETIAHFKSRGPIQ